jgi:uncharacterized protein
MTGPDWAQRLGLIQHPEGGWFSRIHTSETSVNTAHGVRPQITSIHYLLTQTQPISRLHRNRSGILHYLQHGGPVEYVLLTADGELQRQVLGYAPGQALFLFVPGGVWKASRLIDGAEHVLISEAVSPGFVFADHEFAGPDVLAQFPAHAAELAPFIRP